jgi:hypothetical protein
MLSLPLKRCLVTCLAIPIALGLPGAPAWAAASDDLRDLIGARGRDGEPQLERRGFTHVDTAKSAQTAHSYWWSNEKQACVRVTTREGRYDKIRDVDAGDCGQTKKDSNNTAAAVAIGAAALLGIAALAHKSHHRDDKNYDERQTANFERGYRDGLYNNSYHNYDNTREYSDGYSKGVEERSRETSYRGSPHGADRSGYRPYSGFADLKGRDAAYAAGQLEVRGFKLAGDRRVGSDRFQWFYWNGSTRQCVDVHIHSDRVEGIFDTGSYACGR